MDIIRVWIYQVAEELKNPDCKMSKTNQLQKRAMRGDFEWYKQNGDNVELINRKEAWRTLKETGKKLVTYRGYPGFMVMKGYK